MLLQLALVTLVVHDYDEAVLFYTEKLGFRLAADTALTATKRWVVVAPSNGVGCALLLAKADDELQKSRVGNQTGGRVFLFLTTDNFEREYARLLANEVRFQELPRTEAYGTVAVFEDLYGNLWDLLEPKSF